MRSNYLLLDHPGMQLKAHQIKYAQGYKNRELVCHEGGTGKTVCACVWLHDKRDANALVICPKRVVKKWEKALKDWQTKALVVSKEEFKKLGAHEWSAIVVDEADEFASPLFVKGRSQLSEALYKTIEINLQTPILLLTATPIRSNPWNLHTLLTYKGHYIEWKKWRAEFFSLQYRPYMSRPAYFPVDNWREKARNVLEKHADIVLLRDCVAELPPATEEVVKIKSDKFTSLEVQPKKAFVEEHQHEQKNKLKTILEIGQEYRKVLVVAYYVEQVEELNRQLSKDRETFMVHGSVKNQEEILKRANEVDECYLIVQASLGAGFDADTFSCVIFASMSYAVRDYIQMKYRVRRIHNLQPVIYMILLSGRCDETIYNNIIKGKDFIPSEWQQK